jgi:hypothetical protein
MGPAFQRDRRFLFRKNKRREDRLKEKRSGAGRPDIELIFAGPGFRGNEYQFSRTHRIPPDRCAAYQCKGTNAHQMLGHQSRPAASFSDVEHTEGLSQGTGQGQRGPENLPSRFSVTSVDFNHLSSQWGQEAKYRFLAHSRSSTSEGLSRLARGEQIPVKETARKTYSASSGRGLTYIAVDNAIISSPHHENRAMNLWADHLTYFFLNSGWLFNSKQ